MVITPLSATHERGGFRSGSPAIDRYFRSLGPRAAGKGLIALFVLIQPHSAAPCGFYALSGLTLLLPDLLGEVGTRPSRYPEIAAARLSRLCMDKRHRRQGLGALMLEDALNRLSALPAPPLAAIADTPTPRARHFYARHGFRAFSDRGGQMFLALQPGR
ncbi:N-acetyltransferase [Acidocella sp.]|uniref:GNAT family N-acetyltransferase n=1 Tax=Acidocella sp. TaxID=50710 RepID=UPI00260A271D|nr:GNAT family N-acetyltransferase [Acidocella sp.]